MDEQSQPQRRNGHSALKLENGALVTYDPHPHETESSSVIRERTYDREMDINYLLGLLRNQRVTGTLRIDISQGGVCNVRLEERQKLAP